MSVTDNPAGKLDRDRLRELFDLTGENFKTRGGAFKEDPNPGFAQLRESGPVHEGVVGPLVGYHGDSFFAGLPYPNHQHYSAFDYATCNTIFRNNTFSADWARMEGSGSKNVLPLLFQDGDEHRRYRALVQTSFIAKRMDWWKDNWVLSIVDSLIDLIADEKKSDINIDVFAALPLLTICESFGVSIDQALDLRATLIQDKLVVDEFVAILAPIIAARRVDPQDDVISVLTQARLEEDGVTHELSDEDILRFAFLLLAAGSGTTWKQQGITMLALLRHPEWLAAVREDPATMRPVIEETMRWSPTDPMFSRWATEDIELGGVMIPAGSVVHACLAAANRDPARWPDRPEVFDPSRPMQPHLGFSSGAHVCLGMHLARTEMTVSITRLIQRFPNIRLDPDAPDPVVVGMYERGPASLPVLLR